MPRLLLVDDNPSIHKIAESLLAHSDIELVCTDGGAKALALLDDGASFDAFLLDISMAGMDGWQLLEALRARPECRRSPVALMAGVLDVVDPDHLARVSAQDFLKKPVELKDLTERIHRLLAMPVVVPEPEPEPVPEAAFDASLGFETVPRMRIEDLKPALEPADLLQLTEADLWEGTPVAPLEIPAESPAVTPSDLRLEDLDLVFQDAPERSVGAQEEPSFEAVDLPDLGGEVEGGSPLELPEVPEPVETPVVTAQLDWEDDSEDLLAGLDLAGEPEAPEAEATVTPESPTRDLAEAPVVETLQLAPAPEVPAEAPAEEGPEFEPEWEAEPVAEEAMIPEPAPGLEAGEPVDQGASLLPVAAVVAAAGAVTVLAVGGGPETPVVEAQAPPSSGLEASAAAGSPAGMSARALVEAILADPEALELLSQALAGRLSEQALREVAWEVMPDLAERMRPY